jgi:predicted RNA methylase
MGAILLEVKALVGHGHWLPWLRRVGLTARTGQLYMQLSNAQDHCAFPTSISITMFLRLMWNAKRAQRDQDRRETRQSAIKAAAPADTRFRVVTADCRRYRRWPDVCDVIATDPPWSELELYRWLGGFAGQRLKPGGLLLVQCGQSFIHRVLNLLTVGPLVYRWCFCMVFDRPFPMNGLPLAVSWRPVLVLSKGQWDNFDGCRQVSDAITSYYANFSKKNHEWEQPLRPWGFWIESLTRAGELILDPFVGSGTIGVAAKAAGGRRFVGTEINPDHAAVARKRIADWREGVPPK